MHNLSIERHAPALAIALPLRFFEHIGLPNLLPR